MGVGRHLLHRGFVRVLKVAVAVCLLAACGRAQTIDDPAKDSTSGGLPPIKYGAVTITYGWQSDFQILSTGFHLEFSAVDPWLTWGGGFETLTFLNMEGGKDDWYFSSDLAAFLPAVAVGGLMQLLTNDTAIAYIPVLVFAPLALPVLHPRLSVRPTEFTSIWISHDSHYSILWGEDGLWIRPQIGLEFHTRSWFGFEASATHNNFWSWERKSRSPGWGIQVSLNLDPTWTDH